MIFRSRLFMGVLAPWPLDVFRYRLFKLYLSTDYTSILNLPSLLHIYFQHNVFFECCLDSATKHTIYYQYLNKSLRNYKEPQSFVMCRISTNFMVPKQKTQNSTDMAKIAIKYEKILFSMADVFEIQLLLSGKTFQTKQIRADTSHEVSALLVIFVLQKNI